MTVKVSTFTASEVADSKFKRGDESSVRSAADSVDCRIRIVDQLFKRYRKRLVSHIARLMSSVEDAEEVVQETYARLLQVPVLDPIESRVRAYTFRIATNLAYDRFRERRARGKQVELNESELADGDLDPGHIVGIEQCIAVIKQTLLELRPRSRRVYLLRTAEQLSYPDIAERLGISTRTVEREMRYVIDLCHRRLKTGLPT